MTCFLVQTCSAERIVILYRHVLQRELLSCSDMYCRENFYLVQAMYCRENCYLVQVMYCRENCYLVQAMYCRYNCYLVQTCTAERIEKKISIKGWFQDLAKR